MALTLENFEQQIDPTILERGRRYVHDGRVLAVAEEGEKAWSAQVEGTNLYTVSIEQTAGGGLSCLCSCPYDWGSTCKHIAAVLYTIKGSIPPTDNAPPAHSKEEAETLRRLLSKQDKEELVDFLTEIADWDRQVTNRILARYQNEGTSKQGYKALVRGVLDRIQDRYGFTNHSGSMPAGQGVWELIRRARTEAAAGRVETALSINQAVIEVAASAIANADDANSMLGDCIDSGLRGLADVSHQLPPDTQRELFDYCLANAAEDPLADWNWGWELVQIAADLVRTEEQRKDLYDRLDEMAHPEPDDEYLSDMYKQFLYVQAEAVKYSVVNRLDDDETRREFLAAHVEIEQFREQLVHYHIERGNLQEARDLCSEWLEGQEPGQREYWKTFQDLLLRIAQRENQEGEIIRLAENLFLHSGDFQYYDLLKERVSEKTWNGFRDQLITQADQHPQYHLRPTEVFVREEMWAALLERVKLAHRKTVERYREHLEPRFPREICDIYERIVWEIMEDKVHRKGYREACRYLRRMFKLGQDDQARALIGDLRSAYSNRPALLDELSRV